MKLCRDEVVDRGLANITPKLHLLEDHTVPLIKQVNVGLGLLAEHGAECLHSQLNTLERSFVSIPGALTRLKATADLHFVKTIPENSSLRPQSRKRKSAEEEND